MCLCYSAKVNWIWDVYQAGQMCIVMTKNLGSLTLETRPNAFLSCQKEG